MFLQILFQQVERACPSILDRAARCVKEPADLRIRHSGKVVQQYRFAFFLRQCAESFGYELCRDPFPCDTKILFRFFCAVLKILVAGVKLALLMQGQIRKTHLLCPVTLDLFVSVSSFIPQYLLTENLKDALLLVL